MRTTNGLPYPSREDFEDFIRYMMDNVDDIDEKTAGWDISTNTGIQFTIYESNHFANLVSKWKEEREGEE